MGGGRSVTGVDDRATVLFAGGSGMVPLMSMVRARGGLGAPMRVLYSARSPDQVLYAEELADAAAAGTLGVELAYTRTAPAGWPGLVGRLDRSRIAAGTPPPSAEPALYVCGPTGFVETVAGALVALGHDAAAIRTERFGPSGG